MTLRHLKIFIAVAETGKMSLAAEQFYLSQPTVSQAISELESYYHVLLFERLAKKLYITEAGKRLLTLARQVIKEYESLEAHMFAASTLERLRLGATVTVGNCLLSPLLTELAQKMPQVETYAYVGNTSVIEEKLLHAELDVGVVEGVVKSPELVSLPMIEDFLILACGQEHPFAQRQTLTAQDLQGENFVMREAGSGTRDLFEQYLRQNRLTIHTKLEATCPETMRHAIRNNGCLAVISVRLLEKEIKAGQVVIFSQQQAAWNRTFNLVYHKNKKQTPAMEQLAAILPTYRQPNWLDARQVRRLL